MPRCPTRKFPPSSPSFGRARLSLPWRWNSPSSPPPDQARCAALVGARSTLTRRFGHSREPNEGRSRASRPAERSGLAILGKLNEIRVSDLVFPVAATRSRSRRRRWKWSCDAWGSRTSPSTAFDQPFAIGLATRRTSRASSPKLHSRMSSATRRSRLIGGPMLWRSAGR